MTIGAVAQVITGIALVGVLQATKDPGTFSMVKVTVKLVVAIVVLALLLVARARQSKLVAAGQSDRPILPLFHSAGALAIVNVIVAIFVS